MVCGEVWAGRLCGGDSELGAAVGARPLSVALGQKAHCLGGK